MEIISREAAKLQGLKLFFTGASCPNGHIAARYVKGGACQQCALDRCAANRDHARELAKQHYAANKDEILEKKRRYYEDNRETVKARSRTYREKHGARIGTKPARIDLAGQLFGKLTVVRAASKEERVSNGGMQWLCRCDCGSPEVVRDGYGLRLTKARGGISSCGCMPRNQHRAAPPIPTDARGEI